MLRHYFVVIIFLFLANLTRAQENFAMFAEPDFGFDFTIDSLWSVDLSIANRNQLYKHDGSGFDQDFIGLMVMPSYVIGKNQSLRLGFRYRFREFFEAGNVDEKRLIEQYNHAGLLGQHTYKGRFRFEQRFRQRTTYRLRYRFGMSFPLFRVSDRLGDLRLTPQTETLYSLRNDKSPALDQRFSLIFSTALSSVTSVYLGAQFQCDDYLQDTFYELFFRGGVGISL